MTKRILNLIGKSSRIPNSQLRHVARSARHHDLAKGIYSQAVNTVEDEVHPSELYFQPGMMEQLGHMHPNQVSFEEIGNLFFNDVRALEIFISKLYHHVSIDQSKLNFPDFLVHLLQRGNDSMTTWTYSNTAANLVSNPIRKLFDSYDEARNGFINSEEIREWMEKHGKVLTNQQAENLIKRIDYKGHGVIDYTQFLTIIARQIFISQFHDLE